MVNLEAAQLKVQDILCFTVHGAKTTLAVLACAQLSALVQVREDDLIRNYEIMKVYTVQFAGRPLPTVREHKVAWLASGAGEYKISHVVRTSA